MTGSCCTNLWRAKFFFFFYCPLAGVPPLSVAYLGPVGGPHKVRDKEATVSAGLQNQRRKNLGSSASVCQHQEPHNRTARKRRAMQAVVRSGQNRTASSSALLCQHLPTLGA